MTGLDPQPFGVVDIFIPSQTAIDGLMQQGRHHMTDIAAGVKVEQFRGTRFGQLTHLIEIPKREKTRIRTDLCPIELQLDGAVKTDSLYKEQARFEEAEPLLLEALKGRRLNLGDTHPHTLKSWNQLIDLYKAWNKPEKAEVWRAKLRQIEDFEE